MKQPRKRAATDSDVLTAKQAAALLGVQPQTLYAYVSRGLLRSRASPGTRQKRYARVDVLRLKERADARRGHASVASSALRWGAPVVESAITLIDDDGPAYRGRAPLSFLLGAGDPFAACASWLVRGVEVDALAVPTGPWLLEVQRIASVVRRLARAAPPTTPLACVDLVLTAWRLHGPAGVVDDDHEWHKAAALLGHVCAAPLLLRSPEAFIVTTTAPARALAAAFDIDDDGLDLLATMLLVTADHELNASTFAARVTAATEATLASSLSSALATVSGPRHGAMCDRVEALIDEVGDRSRARVVLGGRLARGDGVPGFSHPLYPQGDPRGRALLQHARVKGSADADVVFAVIDAWRALAGDNALTKPSVDIGLVAAARALGMPAGAATAVFAIARCAGWVAHVVEQRRSVELLRPRAHYTGPPRNEPLR